MLVKLLINIYIYKKIENLLKKDLKKINNFRIVIIEHNNIRIPNIIKNK